jgi:predicted nucleic-acid-binding Zn-ribbon protein
VSESCVKCGSTDINTSYHRSYGMSILAGGCGWTNLRGHGEHLHKTCRNCQYEWAEATLDAVAV